MAPRRTSTISTILAIVLASAGCQRAKDDESTTTSSSSTSSPTKTPPAFDRVVVPEMTAFGAQSGWIEGGVAYAAVRASDAILWLRSIPLPGEVAREVAEAGDELGVDLRAEDLERRFALAPGAVISMTIARPVGPKTDDLRAGLLRGGALLEALAAEVGNRESGDGTGTIVETPVKEVPIEAPPPPQAPPSIEPPPPPPPPPKAKKKKEAETPPEIEVAPPPIAPIVEPTPISPEITPPVVTPPPIDPALRIEATKLVEDAAGLGLHFRIDVPVTDPEPLARELDRIARPSGRERWAEVCRKIPQARSCDGDSRSVVVLSTPAGRVQIDVVAFGTTASPLAGDRPATIRAAVEAKPSVLPALPELRGTAAIFVDAAALARVHELERLQHALQVLRWDSRPQFEQVASTMATIDAVERMQQSTLLFDGAQMEVLAAADRVTAVVKWHGVASTADAAKELLGDPATHATVPTHAALCDGALACMRTGGLPQPNRLADRLATGIWATDSRTFEREVDPEEPAQALHLLVASWPNLLGAAARWPVAEAGAGMEGALARNVVDTIAKIEGYGASLRSLNVGRSSVQADYVVYARTTAPDNAMVRGLLGFAEIRLQDGTLPGVDGPVQFATLPEDDAPIVLSTYDERTPTKVDGKDVVYGWLALVDGNDRMAWLLGLPREQSQGPRAYVEVPDIGRLVAAVPELDREIDVLRGWLSGRGFRAALFLEGGEPSIVATFGPG